MKKQMIIFLFSMIQLWALPSFISIEERVKECDLIVVGDVRVIRQRNLFEDTKTATLIVEKIKILKNSYKLNIPDVFYIYINIYPETFENKLKFIPEDGKYILFLDPKTSNNDVVVYKLYKEEPFALEPWTLQKENKIIFLNETNVDKNN